MNRLIHVLVWTILLPVTVQAQQYVSSIPYQSADLTVDRSAEPAFSIVAQPSSSAFDAAGFSTLQIKPPSSHRVRPKRPPSDAETRPLIEGSMVGYIDNPIVGTQIRIRFDDGFDNNRPDRAEFFYAQCGCDGGTAAGPKPGLVSHLNFQQLYMRGEFAPVSRFSFFVEVPVRWVQPQQFVSATIPPGQRGFSNQAGLSDFQAGLKLALLASPRHALTFQLGASFPTGDSTEGLGTNHFSISPSLLYFQKLTDRFSLEGQLSDSHPFTGATPGFPGDVFMYGIGPSYEVYKGERIHVAPVVELVGWRVFGGMVNSADSFLQTGVPVVSSDGTNIVNLKVGARTSVGIHDSFYLGFGQALTNQIWYKHIIRLEYRHTF